ncbi:substrate-binding domain-containing protein [Pseudoalteromonas haloplanktis]|uniref:Substrate-binding domain-containing protein n=1 Tax=Pseudoalteromonas haloplanktis TaxID=228 RepID=A0ABU1BFE1_PSEHA|nr:substrate-binding domain-containing protein [Pseudoalteromonas haloplanktis]MDQ9093210.1 substrate-binding domain-containing protein [Pseudoalteromonas haloplanktis]
MTLITSRSVEAAQLQSLDGAVQSQSVVLSEQQIAQVSQQSLTAVMVWHGSSPWVGAVTHGAKTEFTKLGIKVLAVTDAQFDPAKQVADLENINALNPDIILSLSVDGTSTKVSYQKAIAKGAKLVLLSNPIPGFVQGRDYVGIVTDDMFGMGAAAAQLVAEATNDSGAIAMIYHDADYFITNNRDNAFREAIATHKRINIISEKGFLKEHETSNIAAAMILQQPNLKAIYVSWDTAAEGVIAALRAAGRTDIKVISHDLGVNNLLDMVMQGNFYGTVADRPFEIGQTMARLGAAAILGEQAAPFTLVPFDKVTKQNVLGAWQKAFKTPPPRLIELALKQQK